MSRRYKVVVSDQAKLELLTHVEFLARVSEGAAYDLIDEYEKAISGLQSNPERFPFLELANVTPRTYRYCLFSHRYELLFLIEGADVFVDAVRDCRQDPGSLSV